VLASAAAVLVGRHLTLQRFEEVGTLAD